MPLSTSRRRRQLLGDFSRELVNRRRHRPSDYLELTGDVDAASLAVLKIRAAACRPRHLSGDIDIIEEGDGAFDSAAIIGAALASAESARIIGGKCISSIVADLKCRNLENTRRCRHLDARPLPCIEYRPMPAHIAELRSGEMLRANLKFHEATGAGLTTKSAEIDHRPTFSKIAMTKRNEGRRY